MDRRVVPGDCRALAERGTDEEETCPMALLPDDVLADILRRLPPRGLAACRCVSEAWRAVVDGRRLLRADLLPLSLGGIFINFHNYDTSELFCCPSAAGRPSVSGMRRYLPGVQSWGEVQDHCNGLVLVETYDDGIWYVLNPATRWVVPLPPRPPPAMDTMDVKYLAYDPAMSPDYEVFSFSRFRYMPQPGDYSYNSSKHVVDPEIEQSEWPPFVCNLYVFSSRTGQWEERSFVRDGGSIGTVAGARLWSISVNQQNAVYWRGILYVHCQSDFVMRVSLASGKYHVIEPPMGIESNSHPQIHLGKSANGVYCATIKERCRVQVWNLTETSCKTEWVLKNDKDLGKCLFKHKLVIEYPRPCENRDRKVRGPWTLQDINYYYDEYGEEFEWSSQASTDEKSAWSTDDACVNGEYWNGYIDILGFHPFQEIIFLAESLTRGLAYHYNSSMVEVLGHIYPAAYDDDELPNDQFIESSFPYTPCWLGQIKDENS